MASARLVHPRLAPGEGYWRRFIWDDDDIEIIKPDDPRHSDNRRADEGDGDQLTLEEAREKATEIAYSDDSVEERKRKLDELVALFPGDRGIECYYEMFELDCKHKGYECLGYRRASG